MKTAFVICGALAREVADIADRHGWEADVVTVSALDHLFPERIAPDVESKLLALREHYERIIVVYGDCGSGGALDRVLEHHGIERVAGPHCYEMYSGPLYQELMAQEPGTFVLTDFLVRAFRGTVLRGLGLDRFPDLKTLYFGNYRRVVYLAQTDDLALRSKAQQIAEYLELPLEVRYTGYGLLEARLVELMDAGTARPRKAMDDSSRAGCEPLTVSEPVASAGRQLAVSRRWRRNAQRRRRRGRDSVY
jgi:hypothetical protein